MLRECSLVGLVVVLDSSKRSRAELDLWLLEAGPGERAVVVVVVMASSASGAKALPRM